MGPNAELADDLILRGCALVVALTGLWAIAQVVSYAPFPVTATALLLLGFVLSWRWSRQGRSVFAGLGLLVGLAVAFLFLSGPTGNLLFRIVPVAAVDDPDVLRALGLFGIVIGLSFLGFSRGVLLFFIVPVIAIFGVVATVSWSPRMVVDYLIFVFASLYLVTHEHSLRRAEQRVTCHPAPGLRHYNHFQLVAAIFALTLIAGFAVATPLIFAGARYQSYLLPAARLDPQGVPTSLASRLRSRYLAVGRGPLTLTQDVIMVVRSPSPELWRGRSFDRYLGRGWGVSSYAQRRLQGSGSRYDLRGQVPAAAGRSVTYSVQFDAIVSGLIYGPGQVVSVAMPSSQPAAFYVDRFGTVWTDYFRRVPLRMYGATSQVVDFAPAPGDPTVGVDPAYLEVPPQLTRLVKLARTVAGDRKTPYDRVVALRDFLTKNYRYSLNAGAVPPGQDAAEYFLFEQQEGYCDLFATALTLMARAAGVPARIATGYATGIYDRRSGGYVVRDQDAHAWAEVYIAGRGWAPVDVTTMRGDFVGPAPASRWRLNLGRLLHFYWFPLSVLLLMAGLGGYLLRLSRVAEAPLRVAGEDFRGLVIGAYHRMCRELARRGLRRRPAETAGEFLARARAAPDRLPRVVPVVAALTDSYVVARYGPAAVTREDAARSHRLVRELRQGLRRGR